MNQNPEGNPAILWVYDERIMHLKLWKAGVLRQALQACIANHA
jgi:hypothetical protein